MSFFKRKTKSVAEPTSLSSASKPPADAWAELEALVNSQSEAAAETTTTPTDAGIGDRAFVAEELQRYSEMDLTAELGDAPTMDGTPGAIDVDVEALLSEPILGASAETPSAEAPAYAADPQPNDDAFPMAVPPVDTREGKADLGSMRLDVARIAADIQSGEELYRRAQKRIENLTGFVERAEIDFSLLNRLEPENRRLKARNRTLESEIDDARRKLDVMRDNLEDHQRRLAERTAHLEALHSKMSVAQKSLHEFDRALKTSREQSDKNALSAERAQTSLDVERRENSVLRSTITEITATADEHQTAAIEAKKMTDSLRQDAMDFRAQSETTNSENIELRNALDHARRSNNQMKGEMVSLHQDIRTFKTQSEFTVIAREDEMTALKAQVDELKKQLEIKDEIVRNAARDVQELRKMRTSQDLERERLETIIETQSFQLDEAGNRLIEAQQSVTDFDRRYRDVAAALNQQQLQRQSSAPAAQPDIAPAPVVRQAPAPAAMTYGDAPELSESDIADQITDMTLGLRDGFTG